jgi:hypothetical protein
LFINFGEVSLRIYTLARNNKAKTALDSIKKNAALLSVLGVKNAGMDGKENIWNRFKNPTIRNVKPRNRE